MSCSEFHINHSSIIERSFGLVAADTVSRAMDEFRDSHDWAREITDTLQGVMFETALDNAKDSRVGEAYALAHMLWLGGYTVPDVDPLTFDIPGATGFGLREAHQTTIIANDQEYCIRKRDYATEEAYFQAIRETIARDSATGVPIGPATYVIPGAVFYGGHSEIDDSWTVLHKGTAYQFPRETPGKNIVDCMMDVTEFLGLPE